MRDTLTLVIMTVAGSLFILFDIPVLRQVFGFLFVLFLPGYALVRVLYDELDNLEKIALGIGLSIAISVFVGLALNFTPYGIRFKPILFSLTAVTLAFLCFEALKKSKTTFPEKSF